ncbi:phage tail sheath gpL-like [Streptomyces sp. DSM 41269]|nr:phage tail sheath gpL-like [Streptomyces sp. DSM 41269]
MAVVVCPPGIAGQPFDAPYSRGAYGDATTAGAAASERSYSWLVIRSAVRPWKMFTAAIG